MDLIVKTLRDQPVLSVSALLAALSCVLAPRGPLAWALSVDLRVIVLLFCMMLSVAGLRRAGVFDRLVRVILSRGSSMLFMEGTLTALAFFLSMLVTNDVALITLVPFTLSLLQAAGRMDVAARVVVLETIAANMGSAATPFGNPQNLYLFACFDLNLADFVATVLPFTVLSGLMLAVCVLAGWLLERRAVRRRLAALRKVLRIPRREEVRARAAAVVAEAAEGDEPDALGPDELNLKVAAVYGALFVLSAAAVLQVVPFLAAFIVVLAVVCLMRHWNALKGVDYGLLATFACFFVFTGNISSIPAVADFLGGLMSQAPFAASLAASQCISNVPAAALLAPFTDSWQQLLLGVDVGGLGTPIASLASLISLEFYRKAQAGPLGRYLAVFTVLNVVFLVANCVLLVLLY